MTNLIRSDTEHLQGLMNKHARLLALAKIRQAARWPGYTSIADYHDGAYECDFVSERQEVGRPGEFSHLSKEELKALILEELNKL